MSKRKNTRPAPQSNKARIEADQLRRASGAAGGHVTAKAKAQPRHGTRGPAKRAALKEFA